MKETGRLVLGILAIAGGVVLLAIGGVAETASYNSSYPEQAYAGLELAVAGVVLIPLGFAGIARPSSSTTRILVQTSGATLGAVLFGTSVVLQASATTYMGTDLLLGIQLAALGVALVAIMLFAAMSRDTLGSTGLMPQIGDPVPSGSGFCPFCGEPVAVGHAFCRKCGRAVSK